jgi:hypothetical protein
VWKHCNILRRGKRIKSQNNDNSKSIILTCLKNLHSSSHYYY